jgi:hypothetical protein
MELTRRRFNNAASIQSYDDHNAVQDQGDHEEKLREFPGDDCPRSVRGIAQVPALFVAVARL